MRINKRYLALAVLLIVALYLAVCALSAQAASCNVSKPNDPPCFELVKKGGYYETTH